MTKKTKKQPKLRFSEFTDDWELHKFSEGVSEIGDGLHGTPIYCEDGNVYFINGNNLVDGKIVISAETKKVNESQQSIVDKSLDDTTILMSINGTIGNLAYYSGERLMLGKSAAYIKVSEFDKRFVYAYLQAPFAQGYFMDSLTGTTIKNLGLKAIREMIMFIPQDVNEQKRIGKFFDCLDHLITLRQRELDGLKELKQGMLQKMFPKKGETVPKIRFPEFSGDWECQKLGDLAKIVGGGTPSTANADFWDGEINWFAPAEITNQVYVSSSERKITELGYNSSSAKMLPIGTVLFTSRAGIGKTAILSEKACTNQGFQSIVPDENKLDSYFIFSRSAELKRYGETIGAGSTFVEVSGKQMSAMSLMMPPTFDEQKKIGEYFQNLDNLIKSQQQELDGYKELKKGLLQQMFC